MLNVCTEKITDNSKYTVGWKWKKYARPDAVMYDSVWSHILWMPAYRKVSNFLCANYCVLDVDSDVSLDAICSALSEYEHYIGTSRNHQKEKNGVTCDRFRAVIPFSEPIFDYDVFVWNMKKQIAFYGADPAPFDGARIWFPCTERVIAKTHGLKIPVDVCVPLEETAGFKQKERDKYLSKYKKNNAIPARVAACLRGDVSQGSRNTEIFYAAVTLLSLGLDSETVSKHIRAIPFFDECGGESTLNSALQRII